MKVDVLFFGSLGEIVGEDRLVVENVADTELLVRDLISRYPELGKYTFRVAVNQEIVAGSSALKDKDEVAFMPPFAGG